MKGPRTRTNFAKAWAAYWQLTSTPLAQRFADLDVKAAVKLIHDTFERQTEEKNASLDTLVLLLMALGIPDEELAACVKGGPKS